MLERSCQYTYWLCVNPLPLVQEFTTVLDEISEPRTLSIERRPNQSLGGAGRIRGMNAARGAHSLCLGQSAYCLSLSEEMRGQ